jgi:hypothetical protein
MNASGTIAPHLSREPGADEFVDFISPVQLTVGRQTAR